LWGVLIGSCLAHTLCILLAIYLGNFLSKYLTEKQMCYFGGLIFFVFSIQILLLKIAYI
jgi:putative Ca2+/H+ antiporter (TMEM165/GDT1 family)